MKKRTCLVTTIAAILISVSPLSLVAEAQLTTIYSPTAEIAQEKRLAYAAQFTFTRGIPCGPPNDPDNCWGGLTACQAYRSGTAMTYRCVEGTTRCFVAPTGKCDSEKCRQEYGTLGHDWCATCEMYARVFSSLGGSVKNTSNGECSKTWQAIPANGYLFHYWEIPHQGYDGTCGVVTSGKTLTASDTPNDNKPCDLEAVAHFKKIPCQISINPRLGSVPPNETALFSAETAFWVENVSWSVSTESGTARAEIVPVGRSGQRFFAKLFDVSGKGRVKITATAETEDDSCQAETGVQIDCDKGCAGGSCGKPGFGVIRNGSVDASFGLGKTDEGFSAGEIYLYAETWSDRLASPEALRVSLNGGGQVSRDGGGKLVSVRTKNAFARIENVGDYGYDMRFYRNSVIQEPFASWRVEIPVPGTARLDITEILGERLIVNSYRYYDSSNTWELWEGNGQRIVSKRTRPGPEGRIVLETVRDNSGNVIVSSETEHKMFPWGEEPVRKTVGPNGTGLTEKIDYYTDAAAPGYSKVRQRIRSDGSWNKYWYDERGRPVQEVTPWLGSAFDAPETLSHVVSYGYTPVTPEDPGLEIDSHRPRTVTETANGIETAKTFFAYSRPIVSGRSDPNGFQTETMKRCVTPGAAWDAPDNLVTTTRYFPEGTGSFESGKIRDVLHPDGRLDDHVYDRSYYGRIRRTVTHRTNDQPGISGKTTAETDMYDQYGRLVSEIEWVQFLLSPVFPSQFYQLSP